MADHSDHDRIVRLEIFLWLMFTVNLSFSLYVAHSAGLF